MNVSNVTISTLPVELYLYAHIKTTYGKLKILTFFIRRITI